MKNGPYILIIAPNEYPGKKYRGRYVYEHQFVWWKNTGIIPPNGYQIHHINGDKHDNSFQNLEMVLNKTHNILHGKHKKKGITLLICAWCNEPFARETRNYKIKKKLNQRHFHCSRSCSVKNQNFLMRCSSEV